MKNATLGHHCHLQKITPTQNHNTGKAFAAESNNLKYKRFYSDQGRE